jgi:hypothetical protein
MPRKLRVESSGGKQFIMDWNSQDDPSQDDIDKALPSEKTSSGFDVAGIHFDPTKILQRDPRSIGERFSEANKPLLPDINLPGAGPNYQANPQSALQGAYKDVIQPLSSPLNLAGGVVAGPAIRGAKYALNSFFPKTFAKIAAMSPFGPASKIAAEAAPSEVAPEVAPLAPKRAGLPPVSAPFEGPLPNVAGPTKVPLPPNVGPAEAGLRLGIKPGLKVKAVRPDIATALDRPGKFRLTMDRAGGDIPQFTQSLPQQGGMTLGEAKVAADKAGIQIPVPDAPPDLRPEVPSESQVVANSSKPGIGQMYGPGWTGAAARLSQRLKSSVMTTGVPYTGINPHGYNVGYNRLAESLHPSNILDTIRATISPGGRYAAEKLASPELAPYAEMLGNRELDISPNYGVFGKRVSEAFAKPLFEKNIPYFKATSLQRNIPKMIEAGATPEEARIGALGAANRLYGGAMEEMVPNLTNRNLLRTAMFAPDFQLGNYSANLRAGKALFNPGAPENIPYRSIIPNKLGLKAAGAGIGLATTGKMASDNPRYPLNIPTGAQDELGKDISIRGGMGISDPENTVARIAALASQGDKQGVFDTAFAKAGPIPQAIRAGYDYTTAFPDSKRNPYRNEKKILDQAEYQTLPGIVKAPLGYAQGTKSLPQMISEMTGTPLSYESKYQSPEQRKKHVRTKSRR